MSKPVKIKDIIDHVDLLFEDSQTFFNKKTSEIVVVRADDMEMAEEFDDDDQPFEQIPESIRTAIDVLAHYDEYYIELPTQYEINDYDIVEDFCLSVKDENKKGKLIRVIRGSGAFRRFREKLIDFDLEDQWYAYRDERYREVAIEWCQDNEISYIEG